MIVDNKCTLVVNKYYKEVFKRLDAKQLEDVFCKYEELKKE